MRKLIGMGELKDGLYNFKAPSPVVTFAKTVQDTSFELWYQ